MLLQYKIDDEIEIDDKKYTVNACFDVILRIFDLMADTSIPSIERVETALYMLINDKLDKYKVDKKLEILKWILGGYISYEEKEQTDILGNTLPKIEEQRLIDYNEDANYIYSAFMQVYGIDLIEQQGKLHWLKFKALLEGLPDNTTISKIMSFRAWKEEDESKDYKQYMRERKKYWQLGGEDNE